MITFENFITLKKPIILILNDLDSENSQKIKSFFKGERGVKIYDQNFNEDKIISLNPKLVIDINQDKNTKGIYVNSSKQIFEKVKTAILNNNGIPFIGKRQINKNKNLEISLFKRGLSYVYIEFPTKHFDIKTIIKTELLIIKRIINTIR